MEIFFILGAFWSFSDKRGVLLFNGHLIFRYGSFNSFKKISNETIKVWSKILKKSNSELYLKNSGGYNKEVYENLANKFQNEGVDIKKIIFLNKTKSDEFMKDYYKIDLALDTFPYTGVTTSFQSYLMGVPVLTLKGFNMNSRCGVLLVVEVCPLAVGAFWPTATLTWELGCIAIHRLLGRLYCIP